MEKFENTLLTLTFLGFTLFLVFTVIYATRNQRRFEYMDLNNETGYSDYCFITKNIPVCEVKGINIQVKGFKENGE